MGYGPCPDTIDKATGAQISYSNDRVANNQIWAMHGTAAVLYNSIVANSPDEFDLYRTSFGLYTTINRSLNSSVTKSKSNVDTVAYGGVAIFAFSTPPDVGWTHYFRVRGGGVEDHLKDTTAGHVTAEWLPVNPFLYIHYPFQPFGAPVIVRLDPELVLQYDSITGKNQLLGFNNRHEAMRVGPQLTVKILPMPGAPDFVSRFNGSITYHWAYETYSKTNLSWFQTALTYNLDQTGYIGLTASYQRGRDEDTGANTNVYKVSLTGKI